MTNRVPKSRAVSDEAPSAFSVYMAQARKIPFLTAEEEVECSRVIQSGVNVDRARDKLVKSQLRMVVSIAYKQVRDNIPLEDLVQEGNLGLFRAADKFDGTLGFRFYTYARGWVKAAITEYLDNFGYTFRMPGSSARRIGTMNRVVAKLSRDGKVPTDEQVAVEMRLPTATVRDLATRTMSSISIHSPTLDGDGEFGDRLEDTQAPSPEATLIEDDFKSKLTSSLEKLNDRERDVITGRFDLDGNGIRTLEDLGTIYGVSRERIRQIEARALEKLRGGQSGALLKTFL